MGEKLIVTLAIRIDEIASRQVWSAVRKHLRLSAEETKRLHIGWRRKSCQQREMKRNQRVWGKLGEGVSQGMSLEADRDIIIHILVIYQESASEETSEGGSKKPSTCVISGQVSAIAWFVRNKLKDELLLRILSYSVQKR